MGTRYDVIIIGGGPAGYTAALYCARAALSTLVLEAVAPGGQMGTTDMIDNYPGFAEGINGFSLALEMSKQSERFGTVSVFSRVAEVDFSGPVKKVRAADGKEYEADAVILATGASPKELGLEGERVLRGRGVAYCATCDGAFYRGKTVVVVGGGDTAAGDALLLSKICKKVYLVHRRDALRASKAYLKPLQESPQVEFIWNSTVTKILAEGGHVTGILLKDRGTGETRTLPCDGLFVAVGSIPNTELFRGKVEMDRDGYLVAGESTETGIPGVFAAGDIRTKPLRQVVTSVSDGAVAATQAEAYLNERKTEK